MRRLYVVYDRVAEEAGSIGYAKNDAVALRQFGAEMAKMPNSEDFDLYFIGEFDSETMEIKQEKVEIVKAKISLVEEEIKNEGI